jgi:hypothetical protein
MPEYGYRLDWIPDYNRLSMIQGVYGEWWAVEYLVVEPDRIVWRGERWHTPERARADIEARKLWRAEHEGE